MIFLWIQENYAVADGELKSGQVNRDGENSLCDARGEFLICSRLTSRDMKNGKLILNLSSKSTDLDTL